MLSGYRRSKPHIKEGRLGLLSWRQKAPMVEIFWEEASLALWQLALSQSNLSNQLAIKH